MTGRGTFVSLGNAHQPFDRMLRMVKQVIALLPQPVSLQTGHTHFECTGCEIVDFVPMDTFLMKVAAAQLVIVHAGAGSVIHAVAAGKVPIVVPRRADQSEHIDDHQVEFALALAQERKAVVALDEADLLPLASRALEMQRQRSASGEEQTAMARAVARALDEISGPDSR